MPKRRRRGPRFTSTGRRKKKRSFGNLVATDHDGQTFYEVELILDFREREDGGHDFFVKWKDTDETTWESGEDLCDSAYDHGLELVRRAQEEMFLRADSAQTETSIPVACLPNDMTEQTMRTPNLSPTAPHETSLVSPEMVASRQDEKVGVSKIRADPADEPFWDDASQIKFREIERISVHEKAVAQRVRDSRQAGVPLVLVDHVGWTQFAQGWLKQASSNEHSGQNVEWLDLAKKYTLDPQKMSEDIGCESVPIQRRTDRLGDDPNNHSISLKLFLQKCWPDEHNTVSPGMRLKYLHQWQFPLSETAASKLCGKSNPLPNDILGIDLLALWYEKEKFQGDSPYQYLFMGNEGTRSKLHADKGGLMITIAPIVGEKEVTLVHRSDGPSSLYHLEAPLEKPDLHNFPLTPTARIWRSVIKPGEILIMPQGTYHDCRNVSPCLSYSRFYLDDINLKAFLESCFDGDALEIEHMDAIWNASVDLHNQVSTYTYSVRKKWLSDGKKYPGVPEDVSKVVLTLRNLRNIAREVEIRVRRGSSIEGAKDPKDWEALVNDIDLSLNAYRYRYCKSVPKPKRKVSKHTNAKRLPNDEDATDGAHGTDSAEESSGGPMNCVRKPYRFQPKLSPDQSATSIDDSFYLREGVEVAVKDHGFYVRGVIREIRYTKAAFIKFDDFGEHHEQYMPLDMLRKKVADETFTDVGSLKAGSYVYHTEEGERYRAQVQSWRNGTFYKITLRLTRVKCSFERWFQRDSVLSAMEVRSSQVTPEVNGSLQGFHQAAVNQLEDDGEDSDEGEII